MCSAIASSSAAFRVSNPVLNANSPVTRSRSPYFLVAVGLLTLAMVSNALAGGAIGRGNIGSVTRTVLTDKELAAPQRASFVLKLRNYGELRARVERGEVLSLAELTERYFPRRETWATVAAWAIDHGFTVQPDELTHMTVFAQASVGQVQRTFCVPFARLTGTDGDEYTSTAGRPVLPPELADYVSGISDLRTHLKARSRQSTPLTQTTGSGTYLMPQTLRQFYDVTGAGMDGSGQTIVILESDSVRPTDLTAFWTQSGLPTTLAQFTEIDLNGPATEDGILEATMDIEAASAMAPKANILYVTGGFGPSVVTFLLNRLATDPTIHQISLSAGLSESFYVNAEPGDSQYYAVLAAAGITFFASSGDDGSGPSTVALGGSYDPTLPPSVSYPASDPYVTGVGGTTVELTQQGGGAYALPVTEGGWTLPDPPISLPGKAPNAGFAASGGGTSILYPRPSWQRGPNVPAGTMRCVPDVGAMAAGSPPFLIYYHGAAMGGGGTSLSSPIWAGLCALLNQGRSNAGLPPLGLLGPHIYPLIGTAAFNQITTGAPGSGALTSTANNGAYGVGPNYNLVTGLGSPNVSQLIAALTSGANTGQAPTIIAQPASLIADEGSPSTFAVTASGSSPLSYQWYFNSIRSLSPGDTSSNEDLGAPMAGATSPTYTIQSVAPANAGWYTVTVSNGAGIVFSSAVTLTVNYAPIITAQPAGLTVSQGLPAVFMVTATAVPAPAYQWYLNDTPVVGATSATCLVKTATPSVAGSYTVVITNSRGSVTSQPAILTVQATLSAEAYQFSTLAGKATPFSGASGNVDGKGGAAFFESPRGIAVDSLGNVYVSDSGQSNYPSRPADEAIRMITPAGVVTTIAGTTGQVGYADGIGTMATFDMPLGLAVDSGGNVYVADSVNDTVRRITPSGVVSTLAGAPGLMGRADGKGSTARLNGPTGVAVDATGNVYVADNQLDLIRKITPDGVVTTFAGGGNVSIDQDGIGTDARFDVPYGIAVDPAGNLYISDMNACTIRKIDSSGVVTTLAGTAKKIGSADGTGPAAKFSFPAGIAADAKGNVYVADSGNSTIRKITPAGVVTTIGGIAGQTGWADGIGSAASFYWPYDIAVDGAGNIYVADSINGVIRKGTLIATVAITNQPTSTSVTAGTSATFSVVATGTPFPTFQWQYSTDNGSNWSNVPASSLYSGANSADLTISAVTNAMNGFRYRCVATSGGNSATSNAVTLVVGAKNNEATAIRLINISSRGYCGTADHVMIGGFVIGGNGAKRVLIRAVGPTLTTQGIGAAETLQDPTLEVHDAVHGNVVIASNDNWGDNANAAEITSTAAQIGASALAISDTKSSAALLMLQPGVYSFVASGKAGSSGIVLLEVYDADATSSSSTFVNISTRAYSTIGNGVTIGGFVVSGIAKKQVLLRAVGPTLSTQGIGQSDVLVDPRIELHDATHANTIIATNDNWGDNTNAASITTTGARIGATPLDISDTKSAALLLTLQPGVYSFIASGNPATPSGIVLVEVYDAD